MFCLIAVLCYKCLSTTQMEHKMQSAKNIFNRLAMEALEKAAQIKAGASLVREIADMTLTQAKEEAANKALAATRRATNAARRAGRKLEKKINALR